jgi:hypothetical protein
MSKDVMLCCSVLISYYFEYKLQMLFW